MRPTTAQRRAHLAKEKAPAKSLDCRVKVEKLVGEKWILCARAPHLEAAERHATCCGGRHKITRYGEELLLVYDDLTERLRPLP